MGYSLKIYVHCTRREKSSNPYYNFAVYVSLGMQNYVILPKKRVNYGFFTLVYTGYAKITGDLDGIFISVYFKTNNLPNCQMVLEICKNANYLV